LHRHRSRAAREHAGAGECRRQRGEKRQPAGDLAPVECAHARERAADEQRRHEQRQGRDVAAALHEAEALAALSASALYFDGHFTRSCCASKWLPWNLPIASTLTAWSKLPGITPRYSTGMTSPLSSRSLKLRNCSAGLRT